MGEPVNEITEPKVPLDVVGEPKGPPQACLFVANLADDTTKETIARHFSAYGRVLKVKVFVDRSNRSFAFVQFLVVEDAERALTDFDKHMINGRRIRVERAKVNRTLFVARIPRKFQNKDLRKIAEECGPIEVVSIIRQPGSFHSRGCGFIKFVYREDANEAYNRLKATYPKWVVEWANSDNDPDSLGVDKHEIFIGGIHPYRITEEKLLKRFKKYGAIRTHKLVNHISDPETGDLAKRRGSESSDNSYSSSHSSGSSYSEESGSSSPHMREAKYKLKDDFGGTSSAIEDDDEVPEPGEDHSYTSQSSSEGALSPTSGGVSTPSSDPANLNSGTSSARAAEGARTLESLPDKLRNLDLTSGERENEEGEDIDTKRKSRSRRLSPKSPEDDTASAFAFIRFENEKSAAEAIENEHGKKWYGRRIRVQYCETPEMKFRKKASYNRFPAMQMHMPQVYPPFPFPVYPNTARPPMSGQPYFVPYVGYSIPYYGVPVHTPYYTAENFQYDPQMVAMAGTEYMDPTHQEDPFPGKTSGAQQS